MTPFRLFTNFLVLVIDDFTGQVVLKGIAQVPEKINMKFHPLEKVENMSNGYIKPFEVGETRLLLIEDQGQAYLIENRCGHFGVPLETGHVENGTIVCSQHSISFSLKTGEIVNRPFENADPVKIFQLAREGDYVGINL